MEDYYSCVKGEIDRIDKGEGWPSVYQKIRAASMNNEFTCGEAKHPANRHLNRYRDVSPYDHSRVILKNGNCNYINASFLKVPKAGRNYILTQGALQSTAGHFWLMVWEQKSKAILMLNKVIEKNQIKCHQYWPVGTNNRASDTMDFTDVNLRVQLLSEDESHHFVIRKLRIEEIGTDNHREVLQFHYTTWPDFGVPSTAKTFLHFLQAVRDSGALNNNVGPPVVHCSAGIGRSGTFCLVDSCLLMMEQGLSVEIDQVLLDMRKYRMGLIQTHDQLRFSYLAILEGVRQLADGNTKFLSDDDDWTPEIMPRLPPRISSLPTPTDIEYIKHINKSLVSDDVRGIADKPLPETPISSSEDESSDSDILDDEDGEEDSESYGLFEGVPKDNTPSEVSEVSSDAKTPGSTNIHTAAVSGNVSPDHTKANGTDETTIRRRLKNEAMLEKIREIKTKQKETETYQQFYQSFTGRNALFCLIGVSALAIYYYAKSSPEQKRRKMSTVPEPPEPPPRDFQEEEGQDGRDHGHTRTHNSSAQAHDPNGGAGSSNSS